MAQNVHFWPKSLQKCLLINNMGAQNAHFWSPCYMANFRQAARDKLFFKVQTLALLGKSLKSMPFSVRLSSVVRLSLVSSLKPDICSDKLDF